MSKEVATTGKSSRTAATRFLANACSAIEYMIDRGEFEDETKEVITKVRYTRRVNIPHFDVNTGGKIVRVTAEVIGEAPAPEDDDDED